VDKATRKLQRAARKQQKKQDRAAAKQRKRDERAARRVGRKSSVLLKEFWNLPNMLTLGRIAVIPLFVWFTYDADPLYSLLAAGLFTVASITDVVDGFLARRFNLITVVGKFMDPLADKLIVMAALVMFTRLGRVPAWVVIVLLSREFIVTGLRTIAASEGMVIAAGQEGKWKTSLQLVAIISLCIHYTHPLITPWGVFDVNFNAIGKVMTYLSMVFSVWSMAVYFRAFLQMLGKREAAARPG
jgi:CDP-diacylglycerol---glycerol-3-phosphate 3-phosphatidyltransferase